MDRADPSPGGVRDGGEPVAQGESGDVCLVDRDHRDLKRGGSPHHRPSEDERGGEVDHVGGEALELPHKPVGHDHRNTDLRIAGEADRRQRHHLKAFTGSR